MPTLTLLPSGKTLDVTAGTTLAAAIVAAGEKLLSKCNGNAQCSGCHVYVNEGRKSLSKIQKKEHEKLDAMVGISSKSRLACQAQMGEENVTVEILSFV